jgi:hypothetical protein
MVLLYRPIILRSRLELYFSSTCLNSVGRELQLVDLRQTLTVWTGEILLVIQDGICSDSHPHILQVSCIYVFDLSKLEPVQRYKKENASFKAEDPTFRDACPRGPTHHHSPPTRALSSPYPTLQLCLFLLFNAIVEERIVQATIAISFPATTHRRRPRWIPTHHRGPRWIPTHRHGRCSKEATMASPCTCSSKEAAMAARAADACGAGLPWPR